MARYKPGTQELFDYVQGFRVASAGMGRNMAQEILDLREEIADFGESAPILGEQIELISEPMPDLKRIRDALERLAGCVKVDDNGCLYVRYGLAEFRM